eukprot:3434434-Amphidinium_carterae.1
MLPPIPCVLMALSTSRSFFCSCHLSCSARLKFLRQGVSTFKYINTAATSFTSNLPISKTDVTAHGRSRTWTCVCKAKPSLCAYCLGVAQLEFLDGLKLSLSYFQLPVVSRCLRSLLGEVGLLGESPHVAIGQKCFGGHTTRP